MSDKRRFNRVNFVTEACIQTSSGLSAVQVVDISIKGVKVIDSNDSIPSDAENLFIVITLGDGVATIGLDCRVAFHREQEWGLEVTSMDLDSATHLRRLLEFNLGDKALVERDLEALLSH